MRHENVLDVERAVLVIVDLQDGFAKAIDEWDRIVARSAIVAEAAKLLGVPIIATEQYPQKLGTTVDAIRRVLPESVVPIAKTAFSSCGAESFNEQLDRLRRAQVILAGIESHVCMNQTAHDLLSRGYQVHLLTDCTSSRTPANRQLGIDKMLRSGAQPSSSEMALFELMVDAKHPRFKEVSRLIK